MSLDERIAQASERLREAIVAWDEARPSVPA